jgi:sulfate transport system ATP-binding protein
VHVTTVLVTHDQEEAMQVADRIALVNRGRIEQIGTPRELYERPANEFVLTFVGDATQVGETLVRPHDVRLTDDPEEGGDEVLVQRVTHLGFEVRVELVRGDGATFRASLTRDESERLELEPGQILYADLVRTPRVGVAGELAHDVGKLA